VGGGENFLCGSAINYSNFSADVIYEELRRVERARRCDFLANKKLTKWLCL
jgi:hypothetical protein